jgi:GAF domain-containing protein
VDGALLSWVQLSERLGEVAGLLLTGEAPDEVLRQVTVLATRTIPAAASCSITVDDEGRGSTVAAANELARQLDELQYANGNGPCLQALQDGTAVSVANMAAEDRWGEYPQLAVRHGVLSSLSLPLAPAGKTLGALNMYATVAGGFEDEAMRALAELFAGQAGVTLAGSRRQRDQQQLASQLRAEVERLLAADRDRVERVERRRHGLERLIEILTGPLDAPQVAGAVVDAVAGSTGAAAAAVLHRVADAAGERLDLLAERNVSPSGRARLAALPLDQAGPLAQALAGLDSPVLVPADEVAGHRLFADIAAGQSVAVVALPGSAGQAVGVLGLTYPPGAGPDGEELGHLLTVAHLAAAGLERARLAAAEAAAARRAALLAEASAALVGSVARSRALPTLLQAVVGELADWAATHQLDDERQLRLVDVRHVVPRRRDAVRAALTLLRPCLADAAGVGAVAHTGRPAYYPEVTPDVLATFVADASAREQLTGLRISSMLHVPLAVGGRVLATLTLARGGGRYTPAEITLIEQITERAAISLDNSQIYQRERATALTLQRSLLPAALPPAVGLRIAARYVAGTAGTEVGGDFYDVIPLGDGRTGLAVGDVMGRGIAAAATMGQLRAALRAYALEDHPPAALLTRLDRVVSTLGTATLTTCTYAVYDPTTRQLTVSTAGHLPLLLTGPGQPTRYLDIYPCRPLGVGGGTFTDTTVELPGATTLVLYSDGLVENRDQDLGDRLDRLAVAAAAVLLPEEVCDHVLAELRPDLDAVDDDIALLVAATGDQPLA